MGSCLVSLSLYEQLGLQEMMRKSGNKQYTYKMEEEGACQATISTMLKQSYFNSKPLPSVLIILTSIINAAAGSLKRED